MRPLKYGNRSHGNVKKASQDLKNAKMIVSETLLNWSNFLGQQFYTCFLKWYLTVSLKNLTSMYINAIIWNGEPGHTKISLRYSL